MRKWALALLGAVLILAGGMLAHLVQTAGGVTISDVRFKGADGVTMSALLYVPRTATAGHPAPGILAVHGYINTREAQDGFAIEFARRGYVVLAMDQRGHGGSGGAALSGGFGGPDGLKYLRGLPMVDPANIGLEGHSMGGWTVLAAASAMPDGYRAMVLEGSSTGKPFAAEGTAAWPRNLALVYSRYDEFAPLMWGAPTPSAIGGTAKLKALFGTADPVVEGHTYGSIEAGTARVLYQPPVTHPGDHISHLAIGDALAWFAQTLKGGTPLEPDNQVWMWKEAGTGIALFGFVTFVCGVLNGLLALPAFAALRQAPQPARETRGGGWWAAMLLTAFIPVVTFYPLMNAGMLSALLPAPLKALWPQLITNDILLWALAGVVITVVLSALFKAPRPAVRSPVVPALALAVLSAGAGYGALLLSDALFKTDFRLWVIGVRPLTGPQALYALAYLPLFFLYFWITLRTLHANLSVKGDGFFASYATGKMAMAAGFVVLLLIQYATLFSTGHLLVPSGGPAAAILGAQSMALNTIIAIQFYPLLATVGAISVFCWRRTGAALTGAALCSLLVTGYVVAGTATQLAG
jgi:dienelactone hydrolase